MAQASPLPTPSLRIKAHRGKPFYEAKWRTPAQVLLRVGPAWVDLKPEGNPSATADWIPRKGRVPAGYFDEARAHVRAAEMVREHAEKLLNAAAIQSAVRAEAERPSTFRELAADWRHHVEHVKNLKPSTLANYDDMLREPGTARKRGVGVSPGHIMAALGDQPAVEITTADVDGVSGRIAATGVSGRTVNAHREMIRAIFNFGIKQTEATRNAAGQRAGRAGRDYGLAVNPARNATVYRDMKSNTLVYYRPEEIEALARALETGAHRTGRASLGSGDDGSLQAAQDHQDAEAVRLSAYSGLRLGELLALRWSDVDWSGSAITVSRSLSKGKETSTKSGKTRRVPLPDQAAAALARLGQRNDFTDADELVICNPVTGRTLDGSALTKRYHAAQRSAGIANLRWHDLRHTYGSLLVAGGQDIVTVKDAMGHQDIKMTQRYLHARPAREMAKAFTAVFELSPTVATKIEDVR